MIIAKDNNRKIIEGIRDSLSFEAITKLCSWTPGQNFRFRDDKIPAVPSAKHIEMIIIRGKDLKILKQLWKFWSISACSLDLNMKEVKLFPTMYWKAL